MALLKANTGIGTNNPEFPLHVVGDINYTGDLYKNGVQIDFGQFSYWKRTSSGINTTDNVGIGTSNVLYKLSVVGDINYTGTLRQNGIPVTFGGGGDNYWFKNETGISTSLNVGINTLSPQYNLDVLGNINYTGNLLKNGVPVTFGGGSNYWVQTNLGIHTTVNVGIGMLGPTYKLDVVGDINYSGILRQNGVPVVFGGADTYWYKNNYGISTSTNVGVGLTTPQYKVDVTGDINYSGVLRQNGIPVVFGTAENYWDKTVSGIHTTSRIGIGGVASGYADRKLQVYDGGIYVTTSPSSSDAFLTLDGYVNQSSYINFKINNTNIANIAVNSSYYPIPSLEINSTTANNILLSPYVINGNVGKIGIGLTSPQYKLDVLGDINYSGTLRNNGIAVSFGQQSGYWLEGKSEIYTLNNVGIGTTNSQFKLSVEGDVNFTGILRKGGIPYTLGVKFTSSSTAPIDPNLGDEWYNPDTTSLSKYLPDNQWVSSGIGRTTIQLTTTQLTPSSLTNLTFVAGKYYEILDITANYPMWIRVYGTVSARGADTRTTPGGSLPTTDFYFEYVSVDQNESRRTSPIPGVQTPNGTTYISIVNQDTVSRTIIVTLTVRILET